MPNVESNRHLPVNHVLTFPGNTFLSSGATAATYEKEVWEQNTMNAPEGPFLKVTNSSPEKVFEYFKNLQIFSSEYSSIINEIKKQYGLNNIAIVRNKKTIDHLDDKGFVCEESKKDPDCINVEFKLRHTNDIKEYAFIEHSNVWTKDAFSSFNNLNILNPNYFDPNNIRKSDDIIFSMFGDGGSLIRCKNVILTTEQLWYSKMNDEGYKRLIDLGYEISYLPMVRPEKQKYYFETSHIDCHAAIVKNTKEDMYLLVAKSYYEQDGITANAIRQAAKTIDAQVRIIDDSNLPNLALNFDRSDDGTVICTSTRKNERNDLVRTLTEDICVKKVIPTEVPIENITKYQCGGINFLQQIII